MASFSGYVAFSLRSLPYWQLLANLPKALGLAHFPLAGPAAAWRSYRFCMISIPYLVCAKLR